MGSIYHENQQLRSRSSLEFHDAVHGTITLDPLIVAIMDTPQFQRLRDIKQLGVAYWVFPGATHHRFEHCIGTSYLCGKMMKTLKDLHEKEGDLTITDTEILCVKIAGLCHDLGHGPFSHSFETFMKRANPSLSWKHENASCEMFDHLVENNPEVKELMRTEGILEDEKKLIKRMIQGRDPKTESIPETTVFRGEKAEKWYLYEILSNKRSSIDADKFDYFARDAHQVGLTNSFDFNRFFRQIRIFNVDGQLQICIRDKEQLNVYEIFHVRWLLHHQVYQHKTLKPIEDMIFRAFSLADEKFDIFKSVKDINRFTYLTDSLIYEILRSTENDKDIKAAKEMLNRISKREIYSFVGEIRLDNGSDKNFNEDQICQELVKENSSLMVGDIFVNLTYIGLGMKGQNPIVNVTFFKKNGEILRHNHQQQPVTFSSNMFEETYVRVYCKTPGKESLVEAAFCGWSKSKGRGDKVFDAVDTCSK